jgi:hypothetical protein
VLSFSLKPPVFDAGRRWGGSSSSHEIATPEGPAMVSPLVKLFCFKQLKRLLYAIPHTFCCGGRIRKLTLRKTEGLPGGHKAA